MKVLGILLILFGVISLVYGGIVYTQRETVLDVGPLQASVERKERIPLPPVAGGLALLAGIALVIARRRAA